MEYKYYRVKETFREEMKEFFVTLFGWGQEFEIRVLEDKEFEKLRSTREAACLQTTVVKGDPKAENLMLQMSKLKRTIFVRLRDKSVCVRDLIHEVLHIYYPHVREEIIRQAEDAFETAFLCSDTLYSNQLQRDFFLQLCRDGDRLRKWAGLPKFDYSKIYRYEKKLLARGN